MAPFSHPLKCYFSKCKSVFAVKYIKQRTKNDPCLINSNASYSVALCCFCSPFVHRVQFSDTSDKCSIEVFWQVVLNLFDLIQTNCVLVFTAWLWTLVDFVDGLCLLRWWKYLVCDKTKKQSILKTQNQRMHLLTVFCLHINIKTTLSHILSLADIFLY